MKNLGLIVCVCGLLAGPVFASTIFQDNFDSGVSGGIWESVAGSWHGSAMQVLNGDNAHAIGAQSARQWESWSAYYMQTKAGVIPDQGPINQAGQKISLTVKFWDDMYDNADPVTYQYKGSVIFATTSSLQDYMQMGVNSAFSRTNYFWRTYGNGQTYNVSSVARSLGWHEFKIEVLPYVGSNDVKIYIDGSVIATGNRTAGGSGMGFTSVRLGFKEHSYSNFWYDDVQVNYTPEPASALLLGVGACLLRRRRA